MGRGQLRDCAMKKNSACLIEDSDGSIRVNGELPPPPPPIPPACLNMGCETCAHARGWEQFLLSSIFFFFLLFSVVVVSFSCFHL